jgi:membrane-bound ClpP family serine protease
MTTVVLLLSLGIVLLLLEVVVPGGVLGVIGGLAMLAGCALAFYDFGLQGGALATAVALVSLGVAVYIEFALLPKTRAGRKFFLSQAVDAASQPMPADAALVVGRQVETLTTLAPSGYVLLDGHRCEARSQSGLIAKGAQVRVVAVDNFSLIVSQT